MAKRVFVKGELLGTFGTKFVEELPQETVGKKKRRMCICECGIIYTLLSYVWIKKIGIAQIVL